MPQNTKASPAFSRRRLLQGMAVLSLSAVCSSLFPAQMAAAQQSAESGFVATSSFLVSRPASPILAERYYSALCRHYADFPTRFAALKGYIATQNFAHVDAFLRAVDATHPLFQTASLIIASWYTGVVGEGAGSELIAYADAMMYLPTKDILVVPTYGGGPDSWGWDPAQKVKKKGEAA